MNFEARPWSFCRLVGGSFFTGLRTVRGVAPMHMGSVHCTPETRDRVDNIRTNVHESVGFPCSLEAFAAARVALY